MSSVYASRPLRPPPVKRRRTATSVLAGEFDPRPSRDVLTSLLNGVGPYKEVEKDRGERKLMRREQKEKEKERLRQKRLLAAKEQSTAQIQTLSRPSVSSLPLLTIPGGNMPKGDVPIVNASTSFFWRTRGPALSPPRSISPSPPPEGYPLTPGPSDSSYDSRTSSKRPHTPDDDYLLYDQSMDSPPPPGELRRSRKKRVAARKGWKGWVEGSPPPSDKLINLDYAPVLRERRLRSGKNFDAISEGQDSWITPGMETYIMRPS